MRHVELYDIAEKAFDLSVYQTFEGGVLSPLLSV